MKSLRGKPLSIVVTGLVIGAISLWIWFIWNVCDVMKRQAENDTLHAKNDLIRAEIELLKAKLKTTGQ